MNFSKTDLNTPKVIKIDTAAALPATLHKKHICVVLLRQSEIPTLERAAAGAKCGQLSPLLISAV